MRISASTGCEGLAAVTARGRAGGPLHGGAADEKHRSTGRDPRQACAYHGQRPGRSLHAAPRKWAVHDASAQCGVGVRLHPSSLTRQGFYVAFVLDTYARRLVDWRV